jgi:hypothetical protein
MKCYDTLSYFVIILNEKARFLLMTCLVAVSSRPIYNEKKGVKHGIQAKRSFRRITGQESAKQNRKKGSTVGF